MTLTDINKAFDLMHDGSCLRVVLDMFVWSLYALYVADLLVLCYCSDSISLSFPKYLCGIKRKWKKRVSRRARGTLLKWMVFIMFWWFCSTSFKLKLYFQDSAIIADFGRSLVSLHQRILPIFKYNSLYLCRRINVLKCNGPTKWHVKIKRKRKWKRQNVFCRVPKGAF